MVAFIKHNLSDFFSISHLFSVFFFSSFAWFIAQPQIDPGAVFNSQKLISYYNNIFLSIVFIDFILHVLEHFQKTLRKNKLSLVIVRLSHHEIFWGLIVSYLISFLVFYIIPAYFFCFLQQLFYAPNTIKLEIYFLKFVSLSVSYNLFWIIIAIYLLVKLKTEFQAFMLFTFIYFISQIVRLLSNGFIFDAFWLGNIILSQTPFIEVIVRMCLWVLIIFVSIKIGKCILKKILPEGWEESYEHSLVSVFLKKFGAFISAHHCSMMGFRNQKILMIFSIIGVVFVIVLLSNPNGDMIVFGKIYLGAFLPIIFSFNQWFIIQLDRYTYMTQINNVRSSSYAFIIFNRWALLLIPQLLIGIVLSILIYFVVGRLSLSFIFYILFINIFCSVFNLCFSILTKSDGTANIVLILFVYFQLREDIQHLIFNDTHLSMFNIFSPLLHENDFISFELWLVLIVGILSLFHIAYFLTKRIKYEF